MTSKMSLQPEETLPFIKMDGIGNTFIVLDARNGHEIRIEQDDLQELADKGHAVTQGYDQLIILRPSGRADCFMEIWNADGSQSESCGNAARCVAWLLAQEEEKNVLRIDTLGGLLDAECTGEQTVRVNMGQPRTDWQDIPLSHAVDTLHLPLQAGPLSDGVAVSMGNPHVVFFVEDVTAAPLSELGPALEHDPLFPNRANIGVAKVQDEAITLRVWERGAGETLACGTGACAAFVAAYRRSLITGKVPITVHLPGGDLTLSFNEHGDVLMEGAVNVQFEGQISLS